jgi:hypothetical protein
VATEKLKIYIAKNKKKTWTNPQIKNHKNSPELSLTRTCVFNILNTMYGENCESSWV